MGDPRSVGKRKPLRPSEDELSQLCQRARHERGLKLNLKIARTRDEANLTAEERARDPPYRPFTFKDEKAEWTRWRKPRWDDWERATTLFPEFSHLKPTEETYVRLGKSGWFSERWEIWSPV